MYRELGGYVGYMRTPFRELQEIRLSIVAEINVQVEQDNERKEKLAEMERKQEDRMREMERQRARYR